MAAKLFHVHTGVADNASVNEVLRAMMQWQARTAIAATALTDSSTGTANALRKVLGTAAAVAVANTGSNLADSTTTNAALSSVQTALATLFAKAQVAAGLLDYPVIYTYNGGGVSGGNTVAAVTTVVAGATTGAQGINWNAARAQIDSSFQSLTGLTNVICKAAGVSFLASGPGVTFVTTTPAVIPTTGTAASPGVLQTDVQNALVIWTNNVATIAARLNAAVANVNKPSIVSLG